jgi:O-antigen ligase
MQASARPILPGWFLAAVVATAGLGFTGGATGPLLLVALGVAGLTCRDLWQGLLLLLLLSLTVATSRPDVIGFELPFLLRFVLVSILLLVTLLRHGVGRRLPVRLRRFRGALVLFLIVAAVGSLFSVALTESGPGYLGTAVTLAVPVIAAAGRWRDRETLGSDLALIYRYLLVVTAIGLGIAAATGFSGRALGIHANANTYAFMCLLAFGLDLGFRGMIPRITRTLVTLALLLGVVASGSRGALLGVVLAAAYLVARQASRSRGQRVALILLAGLAILLAFPVAGPLDVRAVYERTFGAEEVDLSGRQVAWENMLRLSAERPFFGHGLRASGTLLGDRFATGAFDSRLGGHSGYLTVLVEVGWIGAILLLAAVALALAGHPRVPEEEPLWTAASGVVVAGLGHMTAESFVLGVGNPFPIVFWSAVTVVALLSTTRRPTGRYQRSRPIELEASDPTAAW